MVIPYRELDDDTLRRVIEAYVLREGTEYGAHDVTLEHKVAQVLAQLHNGTATLAFHPATESVDIVATHDTNRHR
ncbi:MAG: YheU family protein [Kofleriaceae bacterium]|nr:YheU family protein [Kofleriaceae bacterium]